MGSVNDRVVYDEVVKVVYAYLGPAADRFVEREIKAHLGKKPEELTREDVIKLHDWSKLALALLTEDTKMVDDFSKNLLAIADKQEQREGAAS